MERFTISLDSGLAKEFDALIAERGYSTRSEAVRDLLRGAARTVAAGAGRRAVLRCQSIVRLQLPRTRARRAPDGAPARAHDLTVAALHAHLDHKNCIESATLHGATAEVRRFAEALIAGRGERHGHLNLVAAEVGQRHARGHKPPDHGAPSPRAHFKPAR